MKNLRVRSQWRKNLYFLARMLRPLIETKRKKNTERFE